mmetsp:Transcript_35070/g.88251  ORF Transcript_35070/g.88251 Transcript_35070/m.88251 type:complete len:159 (-) Transcript_35070:102-578(-)|eukprot:CAMPEP_0177660874 /NCGR_PEP_ID=MMETSP0447-20121125/18317_1 /TAXON_ID=0 /ORGANISM="Stygamoeba regulata, Strain BSH-02190019" /LENGTH=158 /DNA_ID=CAMNT_0019166057 /DNA_START=53 /DNA_END=529 /DNA_ORIENTATION=+
MADYQPAYVRALKEAQVKKQARARLNSTPHSSSKNDSSASSSSASVMTTSKSSSKTSSSQSGKHAAAARSNTSSDALGIKRDVTFKMKKNIGLRAHRKKEMRNGRVKLRNRYTKAKKRRKGQVRTAVESQQGAVNAYQGELTGINANVVRSVSLIHTG